MVEEFHELDQSQFRIVTVHRIDLSAKCLSERVAAEMVDLQAVLLLDLLQDNVNPLDSEDSPFLAYKNVAVHASGLDMLKAVLDVSL